MGVRNAHPPSESASNMFRLTIAFAQAFVSTSSGEFDVSAFRTDVGALLGQTCTLKQKIVSEAWLLGWLREKSQNNPQPELY